MKKNRLTLMVAQAGGGYLVYIAHLLLTWTFRNIVMNDDFAARVSNLAQNHEAVRVIVGLPP
jgi:hypothetical protein